MGLMIGSLRGLLTCTLLSFVIQPAAVIARVQGTTLEPVQLTGLASFCGGISISQATQARIVNGNPVDRNDLSSHESDAILAKHVFVLLSCADWLGQRGVKGPLFWPARLVLEGSVSCLRDDLLPAG
jgi:hypothetical protein